eukprot:3725099-Alexandrium_andersonii.AAC.1
MQGQRAAFVNHFRADSTDPRELSREVLELLLRLDADRAPGLPFDFTRVDPPGSPVLRLRSSPAGLRLQLKGLPGDLRGPAPAGHLRDPPGRRCPRRGGPLLLRHGGGGRGQPGRRPPCAARAAPGPRVPIEP